MLSVHMNATQAAGQHCGVSRWEISGVTSRLGAPVRWQPQGGIICGTVREKGLLVCLAPVHGHLARLQIVQVVLAQRDVGVASHAL